MITNIEQIISQSDIVQVVNTISGNILKKSGSNYSACCPFHPEKTPSFSVSPSKQIFKCFGCGMAGNAVKYVMEADAKTFPEAIRWLGNLFNITLEYADNSNYKTTNAEYKAAQVQKERLYILNENVYKTIPMIKKGSKPTVKVEGREFKYTTLLEFGIKIYPNKNVVLDNYKNNSWSEQDINLLGLVKEGEHGSYDPFKNRLIFPIHNHIGKLAGFSGRILKADEGKKKAKYINSANSLIYDKSEILYGLYQNRKSITKNEFAYLVEGNTDVVTLFDHGIDNAIASCGTSLTPQQAKLIAKYTDKVTMLFDGDKAGIAAMRRNIPILLKEKIEITIVVLPDDQDPDDYVRTYGRDSFRKYAEDNRVDAILWRVGDIMQNKNDGHMVEHAINASTQLIAVIESESMRDWYIKTLCQKKWFGSIRRILANKITVLRESKLNKRTRQKQLNSEDALDMQMYGINEKDNCYYRGYREDDLMQISNFVIHPVMHVQNAFFSKIIFDVMNNKGKSIILDIPTDVFASMDKFQNVLLSRGNFIFNAMCKKEHYINITRKVFDDLSFAKMFELLGFNRRGFYVWGNGISHEGRFHEVDEYGLVEIENEKFYLPAFSKISIELEEFGQGSDYSFHNSFIYKKRETVTFGEWSKLMVTTHGVKAMIGISWYCAVLFRDWIYDQFRFFPHLNCFGPPGKGKSFFCWDFVYLFGIPTKPFAFKNGTVTAFYRMLMQRNNAIMWADEYDNDIHPKLVEGIKNAYDGGGRDLGTNTSRIQTITTDVNSALLFSGQQQPTKDNAMIQRVISLNFDGKQITDEGRIASEELKKLRANGQMTQITHYLLQYREVIIEKFPQIFIDISAQVKAQITEINIQDRILHNHIIPIAVYKCLSDAGVDFGFPIEDLTAEMISLIKSKTSIISNEDEVSQWWSIIELLISHGHLGHEKNFVVQEITQLSIKGEDGKPTTKRFTEATKVLFLRLADAHGMYQKEHRTMYQKGGLGKTDLLYYLQLKPSYVGYVKGKKMNGRTSSCIAFDMKYMPFDLETTAEVYSTGKGQDASADSEKKEEVAKELPF